MNVGQAIELIRADYLDDNYNTGSSDDLVSDAQLIRWLAEAEFEACRRKDLLFDDTTPTDSSAVPITRITLVPSTVKYPFSQRVTRIDAIHYISPLGRKHPLKHVNREWLDRHMPDRAVRYGTPRVYQVRGRHLYLYPIPFEAAELHLDVYRVPLEEVAEVTDTFVLDEEWHVGLTHWCPYRAFMNLDEDVEDARGQHFFYAKFAETFGPALTAAVRRIILEEPESIETQPLGYTPCSY